MDDELGRLATAVASGGEVATLVAAIGERERRRDALARELEGLEAAQDSALFDMRRIERDLRARLEDWRGLLRLRVVPGATDSAEAAGVAGGVHARHRRERFYRFQATVRFDRLIAGFALPQVLASLSIPSWNQIHEWLTAMKQLRDSSGFAA